MMVYSTVNAADCSNFQGEMGCSSGSVTKNPEDWANRSFQTFLPGDSQYKKEYESLGRVMCYSAIKYASDRKSAEVEIRCRQHSSIKSLSYNFDNKGYQSSKTFKVDSSFSNVLPV